jgi:hypothetical protein
VTEIALANVRHGVVGPQAFASSPCCAETKLRWLVARALEVESARLMRATGAMRDGRFMASSSRPANATIVPELLILRRWRPVHFGE